MTTWSNVPGMFSVEVTTVDGLASELDGKSLPMLTPFVHPFADFELIIDFKSSGFHQRASMYGGADRLGWPESGSDDRELVRAYLREGWRGIELPAEVQQQLFELYHKEIQAVELTP